jgi:hypothetical protein
MIFYRKNINLESFDPKKPRIPLSFYTLLSYVEPFNFWAIIMKLFGILEVFICSWKKFLRWEILFSCFIKKDYPAQVANLE